MFNRILNEGVEKLFQLGLGHLSVGFDGFSNNDSSPNSQQPGSLKFIITNSKAQIFSQVERTRVLY